MSESILQYEEKMWDLFELTKEQMPDLAEAYYTSVKDAILIIAHHARITML